MKTAAFIPVKLNNERLPGKNIKPFNNGSPLINYISETALKVVEIDEVFCFCSSDEIIKYLPDGIKFLRRSTALDLSTTSITEVIKAFCSEINADVYVLLHATAPFITEVSISKAIKAVINYGYDSAFTAEKITRFLWIDGKAGYDMSNIPKTQDLPPVFSETSGLYVFTKEVVSKNRRIGDNPFMIEIGKIEATDIDDAEDFEVADAIYNNIFKR